MLLPVLDVLDAIDFAGSLVPFKLGRRTAAGKSEIFERLIAALNLFPVYARLLRFLLRFSLSIADWKQFQWNCCSWMRPALSCQREEWGETLMGLSSSEQMLLKFRLSFDIVWAPKKLNNPISINKKVS